MARCEKHPSIDALTCTRCGGVACPACGVYSVDDAPHCASCAEAAIGEAKFPLGTMLIAVAYLAIVGILSAVGYMKPALLGGAALLAIGLARVFATSATLRRPSIAKLTAEDLEKRPP